MCILYLKFLRVYLKNIYRNGYCLVLKFVKFTALSQQTHLTGGSQAVALQKRCLSGLCIEPKCLAHGKHWAEMNYLLYCNQNWYHRIHIVIEYAVYLRETYLSSYFQMFFLVSLVTQLEVDINRNKKKIGCQQEKLSVREGMVTLVCIEITVHT